MFMELLKEKFGLGLMEKKGFFLKRKKEKENLGR